MNRPFIMVGASLFRHYQERWREIEQDFFGDPRMIELMRRALRREVKALATSGVMAKADPRAEDAGSYLIPIEP